MMHILLGKPLVNAGIESVSFDRQIEWGKCYKRAQVVFSKNGLAELISCLVLKCG